MYSNIGGKIKGFAQTIGMIGTVLALLVCIVMSVMMSKIGAGFFGFVMGLIIGGIIFLIFWISSWLLQGFGILVENSEKQTRYLQVLANPGETVDAEGETGSESAVDSAGYFCNSCGHPGPYGTQCPECGSAIRAYIRPYGSRCYSDEIKKEVHFFKSKTGKVICPKCNTEQYAGDSCSLCGIKFTYD